MLDAGLKGLRAEGRILVTWWIVVKGILNGYCGFREFEGVGFGRWNDNLGYISLGSLRLGHRHVCQDLGFESGSHGTGSHPSIRRGAYGTNGTNSARYWWRVGGWCDGYIGDRGRRCDRGCNWLKGVKLAIFLCCRETSVEIDKCK